MSPFMKVSRLKCPMTAHLFAGLNSAQLSSTFNLARHCDHGNDLVTQSILHFDFFGMNASISVNSFSFELPSSIAA